MKIKKVVMGVKMKIFSILIFCVLYSSYSLPQERDTLYLFPDTTEFNDPITWISGVMNAGIRFTHPEWKEYSLESILFLRLEGIPSTNSRVTISVGDYPADSILFNEILFIENMAPTWNAIYFTPRINIPSNSFYLTGLPYDTENVACFIPDTIIMNQFVWYNVTQSWYEGLPGYFAFKAVVRKDLVDVDDGSPFPTEFNLLNAYPNPFNPVTNIEYIIDHISFVDLRIYDALGREVAILVDEEKYPGRYSVKYNASHLSSGVYFYKLIAGEKRSIKQMVLLK